MDTMTLEITPTQAQAFLDQNVDYNRTIRSGYVDYLVGCIKRGEWKLTHQGIAISHTGRLLDGQHRCLAIVRAGVTVPVRVSFDVDDDTFIAMDRGRLRSDQDLLGKDSKVIAAARIIGQLPGAPANVVMSTQQISDILCWAEAPITMATSVISCNVKGRSSAPAITATAIRCMTGAAVHALKTYGAFVNLSTDGMTPNVMSLLRQIEQGTAVAANRWDFLARMWVMLDPDKATNSKLIIKSPEVAIDEMRAVVKVYRERMGRKMVGRAA